MSDDDERVHRVTVRGQFRDLSDASRLYLVRAKADHDVFKAAYTPEGTFTYDDRIQFFNLRYEIRCGGDDPTALAAMTGEVEAETFLRTMGFGHHPLRIEVVDASAIWDGVARRRA